MNNISNQLNRIFKMTRWMMILRAIIMFICGGCMFFAPLPTLWWMTVCIGTIVLIDGVIMLYSALQSEDYELRGTLTVNAVLLILLGLFSLVSPFLMDMVWVMLIGVWQLLAGLQYLFLRKHLKHTFFTLLNGILSVLAGLFFLLLPFGGLLATSWLIAGVLIASAILALAGAFKL